MAPASTHAPRADADFDLDVRLSSVIRHVAAGAVEQPSAVACNTQSSFSCTPSCVDTGGCCDWR